MSQMPTSISPVVQSGCWAPGLPCWNIGALFRSTSQLAGSAGRSSSMPNSTAPVALPDCLKGSQTRADGSILLGGRHPLHPVRPALAASWFQPALILSSASGVWTAWTGTTGWTCASSSAAPQSSSPLSTYARSCPQLMNVTCVEMASLWCHHQH